MNNETVLTKAFDTYDVIFNQKIDPRVKDWYLFGHPFGYLTIIWIYLNLVCIYLPNYMKNRKAYSIQRIIQVYDLCQIIGCGSLVYSMISNQWTFKYSLETVHYLDTPHSLRMLDLCWCNVALKLLDLLETIFFILRKKENQVTKLHLYHHVSSLFFGWVATQYMGGGPTTFTVIVNNSVHVIMYTYYLLSTLGPKVQSKLEPVKSKLTTIQMVQFWMLAIHTIVACKYSTLNDRENVIGFIYVVNMIINFGFFMNFYIQRYTKKKVK